MTMAPSHALQGSTAESGALSTGHPSATVESYEEGKKFLFSYNFFDFS